MMVRARFPLLFVGCLLALSAGCQSIFPALPESPDSAGDESALSDRVAKMPKPLRRNTSPGPASGLSPEARAIEEKFGFE